MIRAAPRMLHIRGVDKRYASPVLRGVDFELHAGEVHALMGANGAGKSTLARIIGGLTAPDRGAMSLGAAPYMPRSRREAQRAGVQLVMQELNLIPTLTVAENLFVADLPHRFGFVLSRRLAERARGALEAVGLAGLEPRTPLGQLGVGHRQLVAVAAALTAPCSVLVLDEPTAALTGPEVELVFAQLRRVRAAGTAVLYISHRLEEIRRIADRITVLRDGGIVATHPAAGATLGTIVQLMVGERGVEALDHRTRPAGELALRVQGLTGGPRVRDITFDVRRGEIVGLAGLVGSGRTEVLRAIFGADPLETGVVRRGAGAPLKIHRPRDAVRAGIGMVPEDRGTQAILHPLPVRWNMSLATLRTFTKAGWWIDDARELTAAREMADRLDVRGHSLDQPAGELSGGNQQKVVIARWLLRGCDVILFDEPTRGIDVAAKIAVYRVLNDLASTGTAIVLVSSELPELMALCDRILVLSGGRLAAAFTRGEWSEDAILAAAFSAYTGGREGGRPH